MIASLCKFYGVGLAYYIRLGGCFAFVCLSVNSMTQDVVDEF